MGVQKRRGHGKEQRAKGTHHLLHVDEDRCLCEVSASPVLSIGYQTS